jgi:hypothetical protein
VLAVPMSSGLVNFALIALALLVLFLGLCPSSVLELGGAPMP